MESTELNERLLPDNSSQEDCSRRDTSYLPRREPTDLRFPFLAFICLLVSILGNIYQYRQACQPQRSKDLGHSQFSGLGYEVPVKYELHSEYNDPNDTVADQAWDAIDTSPVVVALSDDYALSHGLELSVRFPWDDHKGIYHVKAFHHLHCLKLMRRAYIDLQRGNPALITPPHFHHCLMVLRQDLMCLADDTPMPSIPAHHHIGEGQVRQCRDWDRLVAWTQEPERHACYHMLDDYLTVTHTLEEFGYCAPESRYREVMEGYFEEHGHRDPYGE